MGRIMLVGRTGCGKTTLSQAIRGLELQYRKTQAVGYHGAIIDTPGEFVENRRYYSALLASATGCDVVCLVQDGTARNSIFPPKFASMFNRKVIGVVSKVDRADCNLERAQKFLRWAGASEIVLLSSYTRAGLEKFEQYLLG